MKKISIVHAAMVNLNRVKVREQDPKTRSHNFDEVCFGYNEEEAVLEASRCLHCKNPKCMEGCPVGLHIPDFIAHIKNKDFKAAIDTIHLSSSLPAICGRVCPQETQCEKNCVLGIKGEPIAIGKLERFAADNAREKGYEDKLEIKKNGKKVAVIGSGPAGLSCATDLAKKGYLVKIFEALHTAGGVLTYGIPEFRLPKDKVVKKEIENVIKLGVQIEFNTIVGKTVSIEDLMDKESYAAVFIASGAGLPSFLKIPGENACNVFSANEFLTRANLMRGFDDTYDTPIKVGKKVIVVGGGNVAMDAARTAIRLGSETLVVYRRSEKELPARAEEVHHAKEEGIEFSFLTNPIEILTDENDNVRAMKVVNMELGEPDEKGRRRPVEIKGSEHEIECDMVIMAIGTTPNPMIPKSTKGLEIDKRGCISHNEDTLLTSIPSVYVGGDAATGAATVILAMEAGKKAAKAIDEYLSTK